MSPTDRDWIYIEHMLETSSKCVDLCRNLEKPTYDKNEILQYALTHLIQVIGEAASHVSDDTKIKYPLVPWREIIGMRNRIVHDYLNVDEDVIWEVAKQDLPLLIDILQEILLSRNG